jgi:antitoxin CptB
MDLILGRFADGHLSTLDRVQLERYALLLEASDPDIYRWMTEVEAPPSHIGSDLWDMLTKSLAAVAAKDAKP